MSNRTTCHSLQVATDLYKFIESEVLPGSGVDSAKFWAGFDAIVKDLAPKNIALLAERDRIQTEMDNWHKANPGPIANMAAYRGFLEKLGIWFPNPPISPPPRPMSTPSWPCRPARNWWCPFSTHVTR